MIATVEKSPEPTVSVPPLTTTGHIHSVETCGTVDGPGVRYVLFTSGCPLRCQYCHNPDAQGKPCGQINTAGEVLDDILKYGNFIKNGGLTISGGEPLMQPEFIHAVFAGAREAGIHTALDTSGFLGDKASDALLDTVDLVLLDIKSWDPHTYKIVTGGCIDPTIRFARRLSEIGKPAWIRFVLVPGLTDDEHNIAGLAEFVANLTNVERMEILPFHKMGENKYHRAGLPYNLSDTPTPTTQQIEKARRIFIDHGIKAI